MASRADILISSAKKSIPLHLFSETEFAKQSKPLAASARQWAKAHGFNGRADTALVIPDAHGEIAAVWVGVRTPLTLWSLAHVPACVPAGAYHLAEKHVLEHELALGWALAQYQFNRYRTVEEKIVQLVVSPKAKAYAEPRVSAIKLTRDLINTPTNDMGPTELAAAAKKMAAAYKAQCIIIKGDDLLKKNYPAVHAVGRAAKNPPHYIDIRWGNPKHKKVTLVGKGVCFDTGGLDIKPYAAMKMMKKDMGGAALMLGLAQLIMSEKLPVRLRVLVPAVENSIGSDAFRPQDVLKTRKGLSMEIGSTDAEGRIILADALCDADAEKPDLIIDAATLTGAARAALGTELPALFGKNEALTAKLSQASLKDNDPMWHMPLWAPYERYVRSPIADTTNHPNYAYAGSITAALFLKRFVEHTADWLHIDTMAWNVDPQPGRPAGGEALGLRALFHFIEQRYKK